MTLNYTEFQDLIIDATKSQFKNASYDLSVGAIIDMNGNEHSEFYSIPSQGMIVVISKEKVKIPTYIVGYATVKTTLSQKGIMANNIGLIDPGYEGLLSSVLINFGKNPYQISIGDSFLRLSFHKFNELDSKEMIPLGYDVPISDYEVSRKKEINNYLGDNFMNYQNWVIKVKDEVILKLEKDKKIRKSRNSYAATIGGVLIGVLTLLGGVYTFWQARIKEANVEALQKTYREDLQELRNTITDHNAAYIEMNELYRKNVQELRTLQKQLKEKGKSK